MLLIHIAFVKHVLIITIVVASPSEIESIYTIGYLMATIVILLRITEESIEYLIVFLIEIKNGLNNLND